MKKLAKSLLMVASFALLAGQLSAEVINVNWNRWDTPGVNIMTNAPGQAVLDDSGTAGVWNNAGVGGTATDVLDSEGNATTVDIDVGINGNWYFNPYPTTLPAAVVNDYVSLNSGAGGTVVTNDITISGLQAGQEYEIAFLGHGDNLNQSATYTFDGTSKTIAPSSFGSVWVDGENYTTFSLTSDASGEITGTWQNSDTVQYAGMGGLQIAVIPEPATLGLLGIFALAMAWYRRKFIR